MGLRPQRRNLVVFSSSAQPASSHSALQFKRPAGTGRIRGLIRISMLLTVLAVRPRWRPLLAGTALMAFSLIAGRGAGAIFIIPGFIFLWHALLIPGDTDADRERRAQLRRELAAFSTPAQRCDLEATLDRYPDAITYEARSILAGQAVASRINGIPGSGPGRLPGPHRAGIFPWQRRHDVAMARLHDVVFDSRHPASLARFWAAALDGYQVAPYDEAELARLRGQGVYDPEDDPNVLVEAPDGQPRIFFQLSAEPKAAKNRVHLDLRCDRAEDELERLTELGASVVSQYDNHLVLRDPEGNEFCLSWHP